MCPNPGKNKFGARLEISTDEFPVVYDGIFLLRESRSRRMYIVTLLVELQMTAIDPLAGIRDSPLCEARVPRHYDKVCCHH
jgi:hypothetical protein